jgi:uncharacterized protein YkwD
MGFRKGFTIALIAGTTIAAAVVPSTPALAVGYTSAGHVVAMTNAARARAGCGPVTMSSRLGYAAWQHSTDMARRGYFAHNSVNGLSPGGRETSAGYRWSAYGENIAWGQPDAGTVMNAWMNSPGHRANILDCRFRNVGIGLAYNARGIPFWTQDFGRPR